MEINEAIKNVWIYWLSELHTDCNLCKERIENILRVLKGENNNTNGQN